MAALSCLSLRYADLCHELDQALPEFPSPGEDKPMSFKKMLANTCQEEYEATEEARQVRTQQQSPYCWQGKAAADDTLYNSV